MKDRFVCVSGIRDEKEIERVYLERLHSGLSAPAAIGFQVSRKLIDGGWPNKRQPRFEELGDLVEYTSEHGIIPSIHYFTKNLGDIAEDVERIAIEVQPNRKRNPILLQLNTLPPGSEVMKKIKGMGFYTIFKVAVADKGAKIPGAWNNEDVVDLRDGEIDGLVGQVERVGENVDYIMFDPSHGVGASFDIGPESMAMKFGRAIADNPELKEKGRIYAGGFGPENIESIYSALEKEFPGKISVDIESGVREKNELSDKKMGEFFKGCKKVVG